MWRSLLSCQAPLNTLTKAPFIYIIDIYIICVKELEIFDGVVKGGERARMTWGSWDTGRDAGGLFCIDLVP